MSYKFNVLSFAWLLGCANIALAKAPPNIPSLYADGPVSTLLSVTKLSTTEKTIYALFEATMEVAERLINATSCPNAAGKYTFNVLSNGSLTDPKNNEIRIISPEKAGVSLVLRANLDAQIELRGQQIHVEQSGAGSLGSAEIKNFSSTILFNVEGSIMTAESNANVPGLNGAEDNFPSKMTQNIYLTSDTKDHHIYGWGLLLLSKLDFPTEMYWLRSNLYRNNDLVEHTLFVRDRLNGSSPCRLIIEGERSNSQNTTAQTGTLTISTATPSDPIPDLMPKPGNSH